MLFGHEDKIKLFKKLAKEGRLSQAYLFYGDAQIGKFLFAKHLAYFLEYGDFETSDKPLIDVGFFSPNEKNIMGVDEARAIKKFLSGKPLKSSKRLAVIEKSEYLTDEAQSSLLKIVEEPPRESLIIFIASNAQILFAPLLSRLVKIYFKRFSEKEIKDILVKNFNLPVAKATLFSKLSFGKVGRAMALKNGEVTIRDGIEKNIVDLYTAESQKNSSKLAWLLSREVVSQRFNLNANLQEKAMRYKLGDRF